MPRKRTLVFTVMCVSLSVCVLLSHPFAADVTQLSLPEGAVKRLGKGSIDAITYSPDGSLLAIAGSIGIYLYDVGTGEERDLLTGHTDRVHRVSFSPDGLTLASGGFDETVRLWDVATGTLKTTLTGYTDRVHRVSFSPDGQTLATGSGDNTVGLWDVATGTLKKTLIGHTSIVLSVSFSPDGQTLATGSADDTVGLWDVATGTEKTTLKGHTSTVLSVSFSPDGRTLASGSFDGTVLLWDIAPETPLTDTTPRLSADVTGDGHVDIRDLVAVAAAFGEVAAAPAALRQQSAVHFTQEEVQHWLTQAQQANLTDTISVRGIRFLEQLLAAFTPKETALLPNYPNPFNPETWIPYQLSSPSDVTVRIYAINGNLVRRLALGHQATGVYQSRSRAAYWDGKNAAGEPVASGVYFYTLTAGDFTATRKMLIRK